MVKRLEISPPVLTLAAGTRADLTASAEFDDGTVVDVTAQVTFASSSPTIATIAGRSVTAVTAGSATISTAFMGLMATSQLTVTTATLASLVIEPANPTVPASLTVPLTATGIFSDGSKQNLTTQVTWTSANVAVATVSNADGTRGQITGIAAGTVVVSAAFKAVTAQVTLVVTQATIASIEVTPAQPFLAVGLSQQFRATAVFSDGKTGDVTAAAKWTSETTATLTVSDDAGSKGLGRAVAVGTTNVTAQIGQVSGRTTVTVLQSAVASVKVSPADVSLLVGATQTFTAVVTYADGSTADVTTSALWSSSADAVSISNAVGTRGVATALAAGSATVRATFGGMSGQATVTAKVAALKTIAVTPKTGNLALGRKVQLLATGTYDDGSTRDVTQSAIWTSSDATVATVATATGSAGQVSTLKVGSATITAAVAAISDTASVTVTNAELDTITVAPGAGTVAAGKKQVFTATANYTDGSTANVTTQVVWSVDARNIAAISNAPGTQGEATGLVQGMTTVHAKLLTRDGTAALTVTAPTIVFIQLTPFVPSIRVGQTQNFVAAAVLSNGTTQPITNGVWTTSDATIASIAMTMPGVTATGVAAGKVQIGVTAMGLSTAVTLTVTAPVAMSLSVSPPLASILVGATQNFQAAVIFSDGTTANVTTTAMWSSSDTMIADITNVAVMGGRGMPPIPPGQASGKNPGKVTITATAMGLTGTVTLTVRSPTLILVELSPVDATVIVGQTQGFTAVAIWDDGTKQTVTGQATWTSSDPTVAVVSNGGGGGFPGGGGGRGIATTLKVGSSTISATYMGVSGTGKLTARVLTLVRIDVTPAVTSLRVGQTRAFIANAVWDDGSLQNVTAQATWESSGPAVAAISTTAAGGGGPGGGGGGVPRGTATGLTVGTSTIKATWMAKSGTAALTVTDTTLLSVQVTPVGPSLAKGSTAQLTATAVYSDFSTANVTAQATWLSSNGAAVSVGNAGATAGRALALAEGTSTVSATFSGKSGSISVTVTPATLMSVTVTPATPSAPLGGTVAFVATAVYTDATTVVVTTSASWDSSDLSVATISNGGATRGTATALRSGPTTISASYMGVMGTTTLTVRTLVSLAVTPAAPSVAKGGHLQLTATATYDDNSTQDVTKLATWLPTDTALVSVSNADDSRGLATGLAVGMTAVDAHFQGVIGTVTVTVTAAP